MKNTFIIQDLSCLSSISMNVALPILASYQTRTYPIPVQTFITQSEGNEPLSLYSKNWLKKAFKVAQQQFKNQSNYGLIGYLGKEEIIDILLESSLLKDFKKVLLDPVMADDGQYYPLLGDEYARKLKQLLPFADIITPNVTELALLTGQQYHAKPTLIQLKSQVKQLRKELKEQVIVVVTGIKQDDQIICLVDTEKEQRVISTTQIKGHFYGTGDAFAATLFGELLMGNDIFYAVQNAMKLLHQVVKDTILAKDDLKLGMDITKIINHQIY